MLLHQCDKCGVEIDRESIQVSIGVGWGVELCKLYAKPVIHFLKRSKLLQMQLERYGFVKSATPPAYAGTSAKPRHR